MEVVGGEVGMECCAHAKITAVGADASRIHDQKLWSSCIISMLVMIFNVEFEFEFIYIL
jgi:hypothetical protein